METMEYENGICYVLQGDYYLPDLILPEQEYFHIGKYGRLRKAYLEKHRRALYTNLLTTCKLNGHLHEVDITATGMVEQIIQAMAEADGTGEHLKATDQMRWTEKRGEPTRYNIMRWDIDEAISRSFTLQFFYKAMREKGYIMNYNPNRKYATIQMPNTAHPTRLKTLGENYTEQEINERILANRHPGRPLENTLKIEFFDFTSYTLHGLYFHYCCLLGTIQKDTQYTYHSPSLRADLCKLDEFTAQADLLCKYNIDTLEQLQDFIDNTKSQIRSLTTDREKIYIKISRNTNEEKLPELIAKRNEYTDKIIAFREDLKNATAIMKRSNKVTENIRTFQKQELDKQKDCNNQTKMRS